MRLSNVVLMCVFAVFENLTILKVISVVDCEYIYLFKVCLYLCTMTKQYLFLSLPQLLQYFCFCLQGIHCKSKPSSEYTSFTFLLHLFLNDKDDYCR